jgi:integration host factor subunit beta
MGSQDINVSASNLTGYSSMNKTDLIQKLAARSEIPRRQADLIVNMIFEEMAEALASNERGEIRNFGSLHAKHYPGYVGRDPKTGEPVQVRPKRLPVFKVGKELKKRIQRDDWTRKGEHQ